jgi:primosomal protein N' (replication factor Y) (superfamily II helicase)
VHNLFILQIAIPKPLYTHFDYLPPADRDINQLQPGIRVLVPFGKNTYVGIVLAVTQRSEVPTKKLKAVQQVLDQTPLLSKDNLELLQWASRYYHHPLGEVIRVALPRSLNKGLPAQIPSLPSWTLTTEGDAQPLEKLSKKAPKQKAILTLLRQHPQGLTKAEINNQISNATSTLRSLEKKGWITSISSSIAYPLSLWEKVKEKDIPLQLNAAQAQVVTQVCDKLQQFYPTLLDGVTGSGKTEVYLQIIQQVLEQKRQALVLVPEINLTPQMVNRFKQRFAVPIAVLHSKLSDKERLHTWLMARDGIAPIVIGTRSAIWTPLAYPGIFIVDEEHDPSYKQQDHFRYSARDVAVVRAQRAQVPVLLGSATPSLETIYNALHQRYQQFILPERAGAAVHPTFKLIDMRQQPPRQALSQPLKQAIQQRLAAQQQVLLFLNRRGYAPVLICYQCGWIADCQYCHARLTYHEAEQILLCHHCGYTRIPDTQCPKCQFKQLNLLGQGTERVEEQLQQVFNEARILRIDSDSTRKKYAMEQLLDIIHKGEVDILVGTQMLAKGHHFPKVTLVGIINIDSGLYGIDFRAPERMAQLLVQVAGRAGRADEPGEVLIQTYHPHHPLLLSLIRQGYSAFAKIALQERQQAGFPPYTRFAVLRAETLEPQRAIDFLEQAKTQAQTLMGKDESGTDAIRHDIELWGPVPAPMEKRAGWYRAQLLLQAEHRKPLHQLLSQWLPTLTASNPKLRWSLDVDPQDLL